MKNDAARLFGPTRDALPMQRRVLALVLVLLPVAACDDGVDLPPATPLEVVIESGDDQTAAAGDTLPLGVVAKVLRPDGEVSLRGIWVELVGEGTVELGGARATGEGAALKSPTLGTISVTWILGEEVGSQRLRFFTLELYGDTVEALATAEATTADPGL